MVMFLFSIIFCFFCGFVSSVDVYKPCTMHVMILLHFLTFCFYQHINFDSQMKKKQLYKFFFHFIYFVQSGSIAEF